MNARRAIAKIHAVSNGWVRVERIHRMRGGLRLDLAVSEGKGGAVRAEWVLTCRGVREAHIEDLDGGGLQLWDARHPAARQFTDTTTVVECAPHDLASALGVLFQAHAAAVNDWIPFDRYLGIARPTSSKVETLRLRGPAFLMSRYARALRRAGIPCTAREGRARAGRAAPVRLIHFGSSYIVAEAFELQQGAEMLADKRTLRGRERRGQGQAKTRVPGADS